MVFFLDKGEGSHRGRLTTTTIILPPQTRATKRRWNLFFIKIRKKGSHQLTKCCVFPPNKTITPLGYTGPVLRCSFWVSFCSCDLLLQNCDLSQDSCLRNVEKVRFPLHSVPCQGAYHVVSFLWLLFVLCLLSFSFLWRMWHQCCQWKLLRRLFVLQAG